MLPNGPETEGPKVPNPYEQEQIYRQLMLGGEAPRDNIYRPLENLRFKDFSELGDGMKKEIAEDLKDTLMNPFAAFSGEIQSVVEATSAKKVIYPAQNALEYAIRGIAQTEQLLFSTPEGQNEVIFGRILKDQIKQKSLLTIHNWALPYLSMYWTGMDSLRLVSERGMQLPMADMSRFFGTPSGEWVDRDTVSLKQRSSVARAELEKIKEEKARLSKESQTVIDGLRTEKAQKDLGIEEARGRSDKQTEERLSKEREELEKAIKREAERIGKELGAFKEQEEAKALEAKKHPEAIAAIPFARISGETEESLNIEESFMERVARYTAETYFWTQIRGEMNTFNPIFGETLNISETMQQFVFDISNIAPNERLKLLESRPLAEKTEVAPGKSLFTETLDYFNFTKTEDDRRWVVATTAAMAMCNAKAELDALPLDIRTVDRNSPEWQRYVALFKKVHETAIQIVKNYDVHKKSYLEHKMAKTGFDIAYAISFGSFSVGDWGWAYKWKQKDDDTWFAEGEQGDPTASGDAFTARRPWFHEVVYWAIKNRGSAPGGGEMMSIDGNPEKAQELANALLSEAAQLNQQKEMLEKIKGGKQLHLARFFGVIGAYAEELHSASMKDSPAYKAWEEGERIRKKTSEGLPKDKEKKVNQNLIDTVKKLIVYVPTPYIGEDGEHLIYPMLMPQFEIGLFDMLRPGKYQASAGDLLRGMWAKDENGNYVRKELADGGRRLTLLDVNFNQYPPYGDDGRAVNNNFMSQLYGPLYGAPNPKSIEAMTSNPSVAIALAIKAADISTRATAIVVDESVPDDNDEKHQKQRYAQRPSLEIIYGASDVFQNLAFGLHNLIGRGSTERMHKFLRELSVGEKADRTNDNLYMVLRSVEDYLPTKQGYTNYSDSFYLLFLADVEALKPITEASERMALATTTRMERADPTGAKGFDLRNRGKNY